MDNTSLAVSLSTFFLPDGSIEKFLENLHFAQRVYSLNVRNNFPDRLWKLDFTFDDTNLCLR